MGSKDITITEDAYDRLVALRRGDERFGDLVTRLTGTTDPTTFPGSCPGLGAHVAEAGDDLADSLDETDTELFG